MVKTHIALNDWLALAWERSVRGRALRVSLVVGTLLALINHADALLQGALPFIVVVKIALTYLVPYCVSTYASVQAIRHRDRTAAAFDLQPDC